MLATYNGIAFVAEQIRSITAQEGVVVDIFVSDDCSTDGTVDFLRELAASGKITMLSTPSEKFGSAIGNFIRLIRDSPTGYDFFAFSDQDDIWLPRKLFQAAEEIRRRGVNVYSSDALAFWPNGKTEYLRKSQVQVEYDHLIESAGPGCTFVFDAGVFHHLRQWVRENHQALKAIRVHDWLIYAWARTHGYRWYIDPVALIHYRQHDNNEVGANVGLRAIRIRLRRLLDGSYRRETLAIAKIVGARSPFLDALSRFRWTDRLWLVSIAGRTRRRLRDRWVSVLFYLFSK